MHHASKQATLHHGLSAGLQDHRAGLSAGTHAYLAAKQVLRQFGSLVCDEAVWGCLISSQPCQVILKPAWWELLQTCGHGRRCCRADVFIVLALQLFIQPVTCCSSLPSVVTCGSSKVGDAFREHAWLVMHDRMPVEVP